MNTVKTITRHLLLNAAVLFTAASVLHAATPDTLRQTHDPHCAHLQLMQRARSE